LRERAEREEGSEEGGAQSRGATSSELRGEHTPEKDARSESSAAVNDEGSDI